MTCTCKAKAPECYKSRTDVTVRHFEHFYNKLKEYDLNEMLCLNFTKNIKFYFLCLFICTIFQFSGHTTVTFDRN